MSCSLFGFQSHAYGTVLHFGLLIMNSLAVVKNDMRAANPNMLSLAKNEGEPLFIEAILRSIHRPIGIALATEDDDKKRHIDVKMLEYDTHLKTNAWHYVDVKDVEEKNFGTGNYVLRKPFLEYHTDLKPYGYYVAFRIVENRKRTNKFVLVNTQDMLSKCNLIDKGDFKLVPLKEVLDKCECRRIEEE